MKDLIRTPTSHRTILLAMTIATLSCLSGCIGPGTQPSQVLTTSTPTPSLPPTANSPGALHGSPGALHGSPGALHGSPGALHGSPGAVHGSPGAVHGSPGAVHVGDESTNNVSPAFYQSIIDPSNSEATNDEGPQVIQIGDQQPYVARQYPSDGQPPVIAPPPSGSNYQLPAPPPAGTYAPPAGTYAPPAGSPAPVGGGSTSPLPPGTTGSGMVDPYVPAPVPYTNYQGPTVREADLIINGYPARTGRIMLGGAVNSDAGVTGQLTIDERNFDITRWPRSFQDLFSGTAFRGAGQTFRLEAAPGSDFQRYTLQFADPNLFGYLPISMSISGFLFDRRFTDWDEQRLGARLSFGYRITPDLSISTGISGQNVDITRPRVLGDPQLDAVLGENEMWSGLVSLKHDTRDSPIQASQGHFAEFKYELVFGDYDYSRFELEWRQYCLLTQRADGSGKQTLSLSTRLGFSGDDTPIFENFFAGGYATLRGFDFRGASPVGVGGVEVGGRFQWLNSVEYMFPITADDAFRGVAFVDFGTVEPDVEIHADTFRVAPGLGLRVAIPMLGPAPLAFDFAYPVAKADTDTERIFSFYMSLIR